MMHIKHELREINLDKVKRGEMNFQFVFKDTLSSIKLSPEQNMTHILD